MSTSPNINTATDRSLATRGYCAIVQPDGSVLVRDAIAGTLPTPITLAAVKSLAEALVAADSASAALVCQVAANALRDCARPGAQAEASWEAQVAATAAMRASPVRPDWAARVLGEQGARAVEWITPFPCFETFTHNGYSHRYHRGHPRHSITIRTGDRVKVNGVKYQVTQTTDTAEPHSAVKSHHLLINSRGEHRYLHIHHSGHAYLHGDGCRTVKSIDADDGAWLVSDAKAEG